MDMDIFFNEPNYLRHQKLIGMYQKYRLDMTENHAQFFIVYKCFLDVLKNIKNSLKLFLYCGLNADYSTGCLPINDFAVIVKDLGVGSRTIYNWINELSAQGVIAYRDKTIILQPYGIKPITFQKKPDAEFLVGHYHNWICEFKKIKEPFFIIPYGFIEKLKPLSPGAAKLYIYCGISMDKKEGFFYKSINTISSDINEAKRSISNWLKELERLRIIERHQLHLNNSSCTHVLPQRLDIKRPTITRKIDEPSKELNEILQGDDGSCPQLR